MLKDLLLRVAVLQEKSLSVPSPTVYTSCLCLPLRVTTIVCNTSLTLHCMQKQMGFMVEENL